MVFEVVKKESRKITDFIFALGYFSEIIMILLVIYLLHSKLFYTIYYLFFILLSGYLNTIFKSIIKEERPDNYKKFLFSEHFSRIKSVYGMPSGHSQNVFFSITYLYLTTKEFFYWVQLLLVLAALMFYERLSFHNHTFLQLIVGAIIGIFLAYLVVLLREQIEIKFINRKNPINPH
uniref:Phosphatidic acid phosphatase type 2/haloperoxidase domain-containing protein n=1 Tax=viral metagenome TaxID=1070528 RepID=A0A6C0HTN9_9ZZZZ